MIAAHWQDSRTVPEPSPRRSTSAAGRKISRPKLIPAPRIQEIHGSLDDLAFKKARQGDMILTKKPDMSKVKWSEG